MFRKSNYSLSTYSIQRASRESMTISHYRFCESWVHEDGNQNQVYRRYRKSELNVARLVLNEMDDDREVLDPNFYGSYKDNKGLSGLAYLLLTELLHRILLSLRNSIQLDDSIDHKNVRDNEDDEY